MEQNVQKAEQMKYRLADAMKQCMAKMPIERITVRQIVELSGTTRQTFYRHFQDKYDLINWYLSINSLNFPLFSRLPAIENSIYVSFSLVFALMG